MRHLYRSLLAALALLTLFGCGRDNLRTGLGSSQLVIQPGQLTVYRGQPFSLDVFSTTGDAVRSVLLEADLEITVDPPGSIDFDAPGQARALVPGPVRLTAFFGNEQAEANITVLNATLEELVVTPDELVIEVAEAVPLQVLGLLSDGETVDLTSSFAGTLYSSEDPNIASVTADGMVTGLSNGFTILFIEHDDFIALVPVQVGADTLSIVRLISTPRQLDLEIGDTARLMITAQFSDGTTGPLPNPEALSFSSSNPEIVSVDALGRVTANQPGITEIRLDYPNVGGSIPVRVLVPDLRGIFVIPIELSLTTNEQINLEVLGQTSNGNIDLTSASTGTQYRSLDPRIARVASPDGLIEGVGAGETIIQVTNGPFNVLLDVTVTDATPIAISIQPTPIELEAGQVASVRFVARFSDGTQRDVTGEGSVSIFPPEIAVMDGPGVIIGLVPGSGQLSFTYEGLETSTPIIVTDTFPVVSLRTIPPRVDLTFPQPFFGLQVLALTIAGTEIDVTFSPELIVLPEDPNIVFWDGFAIVPISPGETSLRFIFRGVEVVVPVTVQDETAVLIGIELSISSEMSVRVPQPYLVTGLFSDGSQIDITNEPGLTVTTSNPTVLTTSNGIANPMNPGNVTVTAQFQGQTSIRQVRVVLTADPFVQLEWTPTTLNLPVGAVEITRLEAIRASGLRVNIANNPQLQLLTTGPLSIAQIPGRIEVTGNQNGQGAVTAIFQGLQADLTVNVTGGVQLDSLVIVAPGTLNVGASEPFGVLALFSDGNVLDVTTDPGLTVTIMPNIIVESGGILTGIQAGQAVLTAQYQNQTAMTTIVVNTMQDTVVSIAFIPASLNMTVGQRRPVRLEATFSSGLEADITFDPGVTYSGSGPIQPVPSPNGVEIEALMAGTAQVNATYQGLNATLPISISQGGTVIGLTLIAPPNLDLGSTATYQINAEYSDGRIEDVTLDPSAIVAVENPAIFSAVAGVLTPLMIGTTRLGVTFGGFSAVQTIDVVNNNPITSIFFSPVRIDVQSGQSQSVMLMGRRPNGNTQDLTNDPSVVYGTQGPVSIGMPGPGGLPVTGTAPGTGAVTASYQGLSANLRVTVLSASLIPRIDQLSPDAVAVGTVSTIIDVIGANFQMGDAVFVNGISVQTIFVDPGRIRFVLRGGLLSQIRTLDVQVVGQNGASNIANIDVGEAPNVTSFAPNSVIVGSSTEITFVGSGLTGLTAAGPDLTATVLFMAPDGTSARIRVTADPNAPLGPQPLTLTNAFGQTSETILVAPNVSLPDLTVTTGQIVTLSGTNLFNNVTVQTGGQIIGTGSDPLAIIASGDIIIRGTVDVSGTDGSPGFTDPAPGGFAGPGGGGGGGGGDGDAPTGAPGGGGSPPGEAARPGIGAGTHGGNGGGDGGGDGGSIGCGEGGGGGALGGNGGDGGGDIGPGTGADGGNVGTGSAFGAGTGGGGATTCGSNSGGGGGGGGGALFLVTALGGTIQIDGQIRANGGDGGNGFSGTGGAGGGSGGLIEVRAPSGTIVVNDTISARGGRGGDADFGDGGGGGGGGIILLDATPGGTINAGLGLLDVLGGSGGTPIGGAFSGQGGQAGQTNVQP